MRRAEAKRRRKVVAQEKAAPKGRMCRYAHHDSFRLAEFFLDRNYHGLAGTFNSSRFTTYSNPLLFRTHHPAPSPCKVGLDVQR